MTGCLQLDIKVECSSCGKVCKQHHCSVVTCIQLIIMPQSTATEGLDKSEAVLYCLRDSLNSAPSTEICNELNSLLVRAEKLDLQFDEGGTYQYHSCVDDFKLIIPEGAMVGDPEIQVAVIRYGPFGPFEYPDGYKPMSPIVWFCSSQESLRNHCRLLCHTVAVSEMLMKISNNPSLFS